MVENSTLRKMLNLVDVVDEELIAADVVGRTTTELRNYATLNKGRADGIQENMVVVTEAGLAGMIVGTSDRYSVVRLLLNRDTRVAARIYRTGAEGVIKWEGENALSMKDVPRLQDVRVEDLVVTSNFSSRFPPNIVVGRVSEVRDEENSLFRQITVDPAVDFNTLSQVFIIARLPDPQMLSIEDSIITSRREK
jgi:rod shape-determining protein MreC